MDNYTDVVANLCLGPPHLKQSIDRALDHMHLTFYAISVMNYYYYYYYYYYSKGTGKIKYITRKHTLLI